ncbi:MAG: hypothetical protein GXP56_12500 [Deltaproteobacteria bacterium]|nr:hypothetical protein [Deltaproteobacteria bacterium]
MIKNFNILRNSWKFFAISIAILILANIFNGILSISSFEKIYTDSLISIYKDAAVSLQRTIERPIQFGKPLDKFYGMNTLLEQFKEKHPKISDISIILPNGEILYSLDQDKVQTVIPQKIISGYFHGKKKIFKGLYYIFLEIRNRKKETTGFINITFKKSVVKHYINLMIKWNLDKLATTTLIVSALLFLSMVWLIDFKTGRFKRKHLYYLLFLFLGIGQIVYSYYSINYLHKKYVDIVYLKTLSIQSQLKTEIEKFLRAGISISKLNKIDKRLRSITDSTSYIDNIYILNANKQLLYSAHDKSLPSLGVNTMGSKQILQMPIKSKELISGYIQAKISKTAIQRKIIEIILDSSTVLFISLVFITELLFFMFIFV